MADETSSVSKGCFLIKRTSAKSPRKRTAEDYFPEVAGESITHRKLRYKNYIECWESMKNEIECLQSQMNSKIFSDLMSFIKGAHQGNSVERIKTIVIHEIPTAALITGVNMPDHDVVFSQLATELKDQVTPFVAVLSSKDCAVMKATMKNVISQFIGYDVEDEGDPVSSPQGKKITSFTMPVLCHWYKKMTQNDDSKRRPKRSHCSDHRPPLVIIFEDFEGFQPTVVQNFVTICSQYLSELPLVLVFGIATAVTTIHRVLPHAVSSVLSIERFQSQPSHISVLEIINKVLMTAKFRFKLGARVLRFLYDNFLLHDFSLQNFARGIQFCLMEHYYESPLSVLCCVSDESRKDILDKMTHKQVEMCRKTLSFRRYVEGSPASKQLELLLEDSKTKDVIADLLENLDQYHWHFFPVLKCLHVVTSNLPRHPLGKKLYDVYESSLSSNICDKTEYGEAMSLLRVYSRDELLPLLEKCIEILGSALIENESKLHCQKLRESKDVIEGIFHQFRDLNVLQETQEQASSSSHREALSTFTNRFELQERLMSAAKQKRRESPYDRLRQSTVDNLDAMFRKFLTCPRNLPLFEVMYYDNVLETKKHLMGMPRLAIQTALSNPQYYLKCKCCQTDVGTVQDTFPDICIAYKLHLECGRLINLYDWLQAFRAVLDPQTEQQSVEGSPKKKQRTDDQLHARFIQAVSELQFLGFIKATRQKTDHVQRLTWGAC
ncbi:origin recognition complex subunit 3-like isoform X1 [Montipora foliosa]|uniref:origin recognition complex subunit 3-like isoform X1 n=2 Tax=Montipora foliosa TaxID=591990 RepID=UPI0035F121F1